MTKPIIYQLLPRLYTNYCPAPVPGGSYEQNGSGKMASITAKVLRDIRSLGVTHVWYTGVIEHSHTSDYASYGIPANNPHVIKGKAGSPYAITDYYDIDPDIAVDVSRRMEEFEALVGRTHRAGMKVIIDFVPNHVAREYRSDAKPDGIEDFGTTDDTDMFFSPSNNFYYITRQKFAPAGVDLGSGEGEYNEFPAKASGNDCFTAHPGVNDWYDTVKLNYGIDPWNGSRHFDPIPPTWRKMLHILLYWAAKGVDGFRCDMVHMVPVEFWQWAIPKVKDAYPEVTFIAEIYEVGLYRPYLDAGFDYLYDKVNLYDTLRAVECDNMSAARITSCWQTVDGIGGRMLNFLENHDEQRFASCQYAGDAHRAVPSLVISAMLGTGPMMIYGGQELGEAARDAEGYSGPDGRTTIFDYWSIPTVRARLNGGKCDGRLTPGVETLRDTYSRLLKLCNSETAVSEGRFFDLMYANYDNPHIDPHRHYVFLRADTDRGELLIIAVNFGGSDSHIGVNIPSHAFDCLGLPSGDIRMKELYRGNSTEAPAATAARWVRRTINAYTPFEMDVPAHGASIWKANFGKCEKNK